MEKFTGKEKAALAVFGLILLAIIIQVLAEVDIFGTEPKGIRPLGTAEADLTLNLLSRPGVVLEASSRNEANQTADRLIDGNDASFWHVDLERVGEPAWVTVDFGEGNAKTVRGLAALARSDLPRQFFRNARLLGGEDGENWELVARLDLPEMPWQADWRMWEFPNDRAFRRYRLLISTGHEGGRFYSMAGLALFE